jgi:micrococcal nuclease
MKTTFLIAAAMLAIAATNATAGKLIQVRDADTPTIQFETDPQPIKGKIGLKYRIFGVDAPEIDQPFGVGAREMVVKMCEGKDVQVVKTGKSSYDRPIVFVICGKVDIGHALVLSGLAWVDPRYAKAEKHKALYDAQANAQALKSGLWANPYAIEPWTWRDAKKSPNACFQGRNGWFRVVNGRSEACPLK